MDLDQIFDKLPPKLSLQKTFLQSLEPEEIFLDAKRDQQHKVEAPIKKRNLAIFYGLIMVLFSFLVFNAGWLQIAKGAFYKSQAEKNRVRSIPIFAPRGIIYDKSGQQLVYNVPIFNLVVTPAYLPKQKQEREAIIAKVAGILGKDIKELTEILAESDSFSFAPVVIAENVEREQVLVFESESQNLSGFSMEKNLQREYIFGEYFSHLLGYVGRITSQEAEGHPDYFLTETLGKNGLEFQYENILRTPPGKKETEVNAFGEIKKTGIILESKDIKGLMLAIDADLQKYLYNRLNQTLKSARATKAAAVAMDPRNGKVLSLMSFPSFDNNLLSRGISQAEFENLFNNENQPFFNRAIAGQYPPGSTIKPFVASAALEEKVVKPSTIINDQGALTIVNPYNPSIVYNFPDWKTHGPVNVYSAIAQSCNIYFYNIGGGYGDFKGLGIDRLEKYLKLFGFGQQAGIDLPNGKKGFVPDAKWKKEVKKEDWYIGDTYHLSIGQGDITVTPLQMAVLTAAIANHGTIWQPQVVDKIIDSEKNTIKDIEPVGRAINFVSQENLGIIREAMRQTVLSGSAQYLKNLPVEAAGKTGTAQVSGNTRANAWFSVFAPFKNPEIVLVILVEEGGEGSSVAVPIAKDVLEWYFSR